MSDFDVAAWLLRPVLASLLFGVDANDVAIYVAVGALMAWPF